MQQIWVAAKSGGFHFACRDRTNWLDTRTGEPLFILLARVVSEQAGIEVSFD
jgi:CyaY protein